MPKPRLSSRGSGAGKAKSSGPRLKEGTSKYEGARGMIRQFDKPEEFKSMDPDIYEALGGEGGGEG